MRLLMYVYGLGAVCISLGVLLPLTFTINIKDQRTMSNASDRLHGHFVALLFKRANTRKNPFERKYSIRYLGNQRYQYLENGWRTDISQSRDDWPTWVTYTTKDNWRNLQKIAVLINGTRRDLQKQDGDDEAPAAARVHGRHGITDSWISINYWADLFCIGSKFVHHQSPAQPMHPDH